MKCSQQYNYKTLIGMTVTRLHQVDDDTSSSVRGEGQT